MNFYINEPIRQTKYKQQLSQNYKPKQKKNQKQSKQKRKFKQQIQKCYLLMFGKQFDSASKLLKQLIERQIKIISTLEFKGVGFTQHWKGLHKEEGLQWFHHAKQAQIIGNHPLDLLCLCFLFQLQLDRSKEQQIINWYLLQLQKDQNSYELKIGLANIYYATHNIRKAQQIYLSTIELNANNGLVYEYLSRVYEYLSWIYYQHFSIPDKSRQFAMKSLNIFPNNIYAEYLSQTKTIESLIQFSNKYPEYYRIYYEIGKYHGIQYTRKAISYNPNYLQALLSLRSQLSNESEEFQILNSQIEEMDKSYLIDIADGYYTDNILEDSQGALTNYFNAIDKNNKCIQAYELLASFIQGSIEDDDQLYNPILSQYISYDVIMETLYQLNPYSQYPLLYFGDKQKKWFNYQKALEYFQKYWEYKQNSYKKNSILLEMAQCHYHLNQAEKAIEMITKLQENQYYINLSKYLLGRSYFSLGKYEQSIYHFLQCIQNKYNSKGFDKNIYHQLSKAHYMTNNYQSALRWKLIHLEETQQFQCTQIHQILIKFNYQQSFKVLDDILSRMEKSNGVNYKIHFAILYADIMSKNSCNAEAVYLYSKIIEDFQKGDGINQNWKDLFYGVNIEMIQKRRFGEICCFQRLQQLKLIVEYQNYFQHLFIS